MTSVYPGALDALATNKADATPTLTDHKNHHNDLADAVNKIETELGINAGLSRHTYTAWQFGTALTDVTLQAMLTAARTAGGGLCIVPPGTWATAADLIIGSNTTLWLMPGATIKRTSTTATVAVIKNFAAGDTDIHIGGDGTIWRNGEATTANTPLDNVVQLTQVMRCSVRGVRVRGGAKGVHLLGCSKWNVEGNWFDTFVDNGFAANPDGGIQTGYGRVSGNHFDTPTASGFTLGSSSCLNTQDSVTIEGNTFQDCGTNAIECAYNITRLAHVSVIGNVMEWSGAANVDNSILFTDRSDDILIEGNVIERGDINVSTIAAGDTNNRISVIGNKLDRTLQLENVTNGLVQGNTIVTGLLNISSCHDVLVADCTVHGGAISGFKMGNRGGAQTCLRIRFSNCVSYDNGTAHTAGDRYGFAIVNGDYATVDNCRAYQTGAGDQTHGLFVDSTTSFLDRNNDFVGNATAPRATFGGSPTLRAFPGQEISYTETSSGLTVTATTDATGQEFIAAPAITLDGNTGVEVIVHAPYCNTPNAAGAALAVSLWDGATNLGRIAYFTSETATTNSYHPFAFHVRLMPTAASHTFKIKAHVTSGTGTIGAGSGGAGNYWPGSIRLVGTGT